MGTCCAMTFCCDDADARMAKPLVTESTPFGKQGKSGSATKDAYAERYGLREEKCIQGGPTTDIELCEFLQQNISIEGIECLVVISSKPCHAYRLPEEEATVTGIQILGQMVLANKETLKIFHLNRQRLDWNRSQNISDALTECTQLEIVDLYDCLINNDECIALFDALKNIPTMREVCCMHSCIYLIDNRIDNIKINFGKNDINAETRMRVQDDLENSYPNIMVVF